MYELNDIEKERLRAELEYLAAINKKLEPTKGKLNSFISHPFVLTVMGGLILTSISACLQNSYVLSQQELQRRHEISQQKLQYQKQLRDNKISVFSNFSEKFEQQFNVLLNIHMQRVYINSLSKKLETCSSTREKQKVKKEKDFNTELFTKAVDEDMKNHKIIATISSVQAVFKNIDVQKSAESLIRQVEHMDANDKLPENEYKEIGKSVYTNFKELLKYMGDEINEPLTTF